MFHGYIDIHTGKPNWDATAKRCGSPEGDIKVKTENSTSLTTPSAHRTDVGLRFSPQLIETARRSFRQNNAAPVLLAYQRDPYLRPMTKSVHSYPDSRFSYASLRRRVEQRHSFRVPDLPVIPSDTSEDSEQSVSNSPPVSINDISCSTGRCGDQWRTSCDEKASGYLLSFAARAADEQLKEQALAAFPNEQIYQPISHFAFDREDSSGEEWDQEGDYGMSGIIIDFPALRRHSTTDLIWELEELRKHKEKSEQRSEEGKLVLEQSRFSAAAIIARRAAEDAERSKILSAWQDVGGRGPKRMIGPPLIGEDLVFPTSLSPQATRSENELWDHRQENGGTRKTRNGPLWAPPMHPNFESDETNRGLWMGTCRVPISGSMESDVTNQPSRRLEIRCMYKRTNSDPDDSSVVSTVPTDHIPGDSPAVLQKRNSGMNDSNADFVHEQEIKREFDDNFVTQIYNYLSLGYPCLARYFDKELSRISKIPLRELRKDDSYANAKGYLGIPGKNQETQCAKDVCIRWIALRIYIHEWARQHSNLDTSDSYSLNVVSGCGIQPRRGSWAF